MKRIDDVMMLVLGATAVALLIMTMSYANLHETNTVQANEAVIDEGCSPADYAHIPYPDEYDFYCVGNTMEIWDGEEYITSEIRGTRATVQAEDGSIVPANYYEEELNNGN